MICGYKITRALRYIFFLNKIYLKYFLAIYLIMNITILNISDLCTFLLRLFYFHEYMFGEIFRILNTRIF
jgi:hypothetical protein